MNGPLRRKSEKWGGYTYLCAYHHNMGGKECVHENQIMDLELKKEFQMNFEKLYGHELWMKEFHKNYI